MSVHALARKARDCGCAAVLVTLLPAGAWGTPAGPALWALVH